MVVLERGSDAQVDGLGGSPALTQQHCQSIRAADDGRLQKTQSLIRHTCKAQLDRSRSLPDAVQPSRRVHMVEGRRLGGRGKHIQLVSQPIRLFLIGPVSQPSHSAL